VTTASRVVQNLIGQATLPAQIRGRILDAAEGNPLFVEEMLKMLIDDGLLERNNGEWVATADLSRMSTAEDDPGSNHGPSGSPPAA